MDKVVEAWVEIVHWPKGRDRLGRPEWQLALKARTARGLVKTHWAHPPFTYQAHAIFAARAFCQREGVPLRSAAVIPFPPKKVAA